MRPSPLLFGSIVWNGPAAFLCYTENATDSPFELSFQPDMTKQEFLNAMDGLLELPAGTLTGSEALDDLEGWNSLAMVEYIALADSNGAKLSPRQVRECETIDDLGRLAKVE